MRTEFERRASELCAQCGMCCNGVLFDQMRVQEGDSVRALTALGLKLKRRGAEASFFQPCPVHREGSCAIYPHRPVRCREFVCRQLLLLEADETSSASVLGKIQEAARQAERIRELFRALGDEREHKSFSVRLAAVRTPPFDDSPEAADRREELEKAIGTLEELLRRDFRIEDKRADRFLDRT